MKKQTKSNWQTIVFATIAIVFVFGIFTATFAQEKSIAERYGSREPRTCEDTKAPARGAITAALALKYLNCQMEYVSGNGNLYLVENVKVEVGGGISYAAIIGSRSLSEIDVKHPVYPIRGSLISYSCRNQLTEYSGPPNTNCATYNNLKATGYCYKTTFGDWSCYMNDPAANNDANIRHGVAPPKGANNAAGDAPNDKPADTNPKQPVNPKDTKQNATKKVEPDTTDRDENGYVKPDFSGIEEYAEIVRYEYDFSTNRFNVLIKTTKKTNVCRQWFINFYDADGVKLKAEDNFVEKTTCTPEIGEPTWIYAYTPNRMEMKEVKKIAIIRKPN